MAKGYTLPPKVDNPATRQEYAHRPAPPTVSILYMIRVVLVALATPLLALEPHTFQGHGHQAVDYTLLFIPFCLYVVMVALAFKRKQLFPYFVHVLCGYNLVLFALTFTPYFLEENHILVFLLAIDLAMVIYLHRSSRAAIYYSFGKNSGFGKNSSFGKNSGFGKNSSFGKNRAQREEGRP